MPEVTRAAIYVRVSTEGQGEHGFSIPAQVDACRRLIEERGWVEHDVYEDWASGKTDRREAFLRMIDDGKRGTFQAVVVFKYSRFGRDSLDAMFYERELRKAGASLHSCTEQYDEKSASGWFMKYMNQGFAEFENRTKAEHVEAGMKKKLELGGWPWRAPLGYLNRRTYTGLRDRHTSVELDPERAPLIRQAFELWSTGEYALQGLADELERRGLRTREGRTLNAQKLKNLLRNEFYVGIVSSSAFDVRAQGMHEPLVSQQLFDRGQAVLAMRGRATKQSRNTDQPLRGLVWCACGQRMTIDGPKKGRYVYLRCMSHVNKRLEGCHQKGMPLGPIMSQLATEILPSLYVAPDDVEAVHADLLELSLASEQDANEELRSLATRLAHERLRLDKLVDLRLDGEITKEQLEHKKVKSEKSIAIMATRQAELELRIAQRTADVDMVVRLANSLPSLWSQGDASEQRELLQIVFEKFVISGGRIVRPVLKEPFRMLEARRGSVRAAYRDAGTSGAEDSLARAGETPRSRAKQKFRPSDELGQ